MLTGNEILQYIKKGKIKIENFKSENLGPVSYDLTISDKVRYIQNQCLDFNYKLISVISPEIDEKFKNLPIKLEFGDAMVFSTDEIITVDNTITGIVHARSSLTKLPLLFNIAGLVDPGFIGTLTGTIYNFSGYDIIIPKMRIMQICFFEHKAVEIDYSKRKSSKNLYQEGEKSLIPKTDIEFRDLENTSVIDGRVILYVDGAGGLFKNSKTGVIEQRGKSMVSLYCPIYDERIQTKYPTGLTNNRAELLAILKGIKYLREKRIFSAIIYSDSELAVYGTNDRDARKTIRNKELLIIKNQILKLLKEKLGKDYKISWVPKKLQKAHPI